jgi:hypothetical protein
MIFLSRPLLFSKATDQFHRGCIGLWRFVRENNTRRSGPIYRSFGAVCSSSVRMRPSVGRIFVPFFIGFGSLPLGGWQLLLHQIFVTGQLALITDTFRRIWFNQKSFKLLERRLALNLNRTASCQKWNWDGVVALSSPNKISDTDTSRVVCDVCKVNRVTCTELHTM